MHESGLLPAKKAAVIGFVVAILAVGSLRFALSVSGVPDRLATYCSMTAVIVLGMIYFAIVCAKWKDRLLAAYVLFLPYTFVDVIALGYTWVTGQPTIFQRHEHAFGLTVGQHLSTMLVSGLTSGPLFAFVLMSAIGWVYWKVRIPRRAAESPASPIARPSQDS